jgi:flagellar biosynthetic protein FlhB
VADSDAQRQDRTEQASPKKLADARRKGQVPRSRELGATAVLLSGAGALILLQPRFSQGLQGLLADGLSLSRAEVFDTAGSPGQFLASLANSIELLWPLWLVLLIAAIGGPMAMGGWAFSFEQIVPKLEKLDPTKGLKRVFGWTGVSELAKALLKFLIVGVAAIALIWWLAPQFMGLGSMHVNQALAATARLTGLCFLGFAAALLLIAAYDVPFQYWQFKRQMRMTKQEVKDEQKELEGRPEIRQRIRSAQQDIATQRMMADVPKADVILINPTHYSVALRYDSGSMQAPRVLARGADLVALSIRRVGEAHGVPIFEHRLLTQALYHNSKVGQEISPRLYLAVAQVLTYVYQLTGRSPLARGQKRVRPDPDVAQDLLVPARVRRREARGQGTAPDKRASASRGPRSEPDSRISANGNAAE